MATVPAAAAAAAAATAGRVSITGSGEPSASEVDVKSPGCTAAAVTESQETGAAFHILVGEAEIGVDQEHSQRRGGP